MINHEKTVKGLAKALSEIADALPRVQIRSGLFPTERMRDVVSKLCADILKFLTRAHKWYCEGSLKRTIHSFTQPFDLRYADILEDIKHGSFVVKDLASCGQSVELRHVNNKIDQLGEALMGMNSKLETAITNFIAVEVSNTQRFNEISTTTSRESLVH